MRSLSLTLLAALTACASGTGAVGTTPPTETVRVTGSGQVGGNTAMSITASPTIAKTTSLPYALEDVWRVLPGAYETVGVPLTVRDASAHRMGNEGFTGRRQLKGVSMVRYFDCGQTQMAPSADTYEIRMTVTSTATAGAQGTTSLSTMADAQARPISFSGEYVRCSSKGALEQRIADAVRTALQK